MRVNFSDVGFGYRVGAITRLSRRGVPPVHKVAGVQKATMRTDSNATFPKLKKRQAPTGFDEYLKEAQRSYKA